MTAVTVIHPCPHDRRGAREIAARRHRPSVSVRALSRRRAVALLVLVAACLALRSAVGGLGGGPLATSGPPGAGVAHRPGLVRVVQPGDTLWEVARAFQPDGDLRPLVDQLSAERGGRPLLVGERVRAP